MKLTLETAEIFVPDGAPADVALARTTHMAFGAHQDDLEIMAFPGILACFHRPDRWFAGVVVTNGAGSPRDEVYKHYTDEEMRAVRGKEQRKAAVVGEYGAQVLLDYPSAALRDATNPAPVDDMVALLRAARPNVVYTHNLADKHDTHVAVAVRLIEALRRLSPEEQPESVYGCEVWRDLDWMIDDDKIVFDCTGHENLQAALLGLFDSQIAGGKRYDLATLGRRKAHATYYSSRSVDTMAGLNFAMDLTPLMLDPARNVAAYAQEYIDRFAAEVRTRVTNLSP